MSNSPNARALFYVITCSRCDSWNPCLLRLIDTMSCRFHHLDTVECSTCVGLKQCHFCRLEYQIDVRNKNTVKFDGKFGFAFTVTSWVVVGAGLSPLDPTWYNHFIRDYFPCKVSKSVRVEFVPGSIKGAYETLYFNSAIPADGPTVVQIPRTPTTTNTTSRNRVLSRKSTTSSSIDVVHDNLAFQKKTTSVVSITDNTHWY